MNKELNLDQSFWNERYLLNDIGWDLGQVSPPLKAYIDQLFWEISLLIKLNII